LVVPVALGLLVACASDDGFRGSSERSLEADIDATRNVGPTSADPGALRGSRNPFLPADTDKGSVQGQIPAPVRAAPGPSSAGISGLAQDPAARGDAQAGRAFALENCRPCHVVAPTSASAVRFANAPEFRAIANDARTTQLGLTVWLTNPHPTMPTLVLSPQETRDVIAYILSLRNKP
jgi:mono/diheme cytochrome c family protein